MKNYFRAADILLPKKCEFDKWAVIACDQHTSEPAYWESARKYIGSTPSTLDMFFPEADLSRINEQQLQKYAETMQNRIDTGFFLEYPNCYIYVERTLASGKIRQGIIGIVDLEYYDYDPKSTTMIFATEATVLQRVPPRVALRKESSLEFSHTVMFCDDLSCSLVESVGCLRDTLPRLYDFDLMMDGGHVSGFLLNGSAARDFDEKIRRYEEKNVYLIGDGNHSLVTAKLTYNTMKAADPNLDWEHHPARYAMVELENIHADAMVFEPIYRILKSNNAEKIVRELEKLGTGSGIPVHWYCGDQKGCAYLSEEEDALPIELLQHRMDDWLSVYTGSIDYIHGAHTVKKLAKEPNTIGFLVPDMDKSLLFPYILSGKVMPKKTFSIGRAEEKRYYLEGRKIR